MTGFDLDHPKLNFYFDNEVFTTTICRNLIAARSHRRLQKKNHLPIATYVLNTYLWL